jgi:hypothetical protein
VNRLSWLVASQSFLFTAYAITLNGLAGPGNATILERQAMLCRLIPVVGVATTGLIYTGLIAGWRATAWLRRVFHARVPDATRLGLPPIHAPSAVIALGQVAPRVLPLVFLVVWLYLLVAGFR